MKELNFFYLNFYLFQSQSFRDRDRKRGGKELCELVLWFTPILLQHAGLVQAEVRSFMQVCYMGGTGLHTWTTSCCFPQAISRKLDRNWNSQDAYQCPYEILVLQVVTLSSMPEYHPWQSSIPSNYKQNESFILHLSLCNNIKII